MVDLKIVLSYIATTFIFGTSATTTDFRLINVGFSIFVV
jgi:hypothetical protein